MTATATAVEDTVLIAMSGKKLKELCDSEKELGYVLLQRVPPILSQRLLSTRLLSTRLQLMGLFLGNEHQRDVRMK